MKAGILAAVCAGIPLKAQFTKAQELGRQSPADRTGHDRIAHTSGGPP